MKCPVCNSEFSYTMDLTEHMLTIHSLMSASKIETTPLAPSNELREKITAKIEFGNEDVPSDRVSKIILSAVWSKIIALDKYHRPEDGMACIPLNLLEEAILGKRE